MLEIIEAIDKARRSGNMNNGEFAEFLGVDGSYWSLIRNGKRTLTKEFLSKVGIKIPSLQMQIAQYMFKEE